MKNVQLASSMVAARIIAIRDDKGQINDVTCCRIFDALEEIDFAAIIKSKLDEHEIRAKGLTITVDCGECLETQNN